MNPMIPRYAPVATITEQRDAFVSLRVMHNNDEVNENDEIVRRVVGKLHGSTSKESYNLMARFSGSYTALLKKLFRVCIERLVLANLLTKSFTAFRYAPFSNSFRNELRPARIV